MNSKRRWITIAVVLSLLGTSLVFAQRRFGDRYRNFGFFSAMQNEPPDTEFILARLRSSRTRDGWAHDYPTAEEHILQILNEVSGLNVDRTSYRIVDIGSPELFQHPFSYVSHPDEMNLSEEELVNFRQYIDRGGFIMVDDFGGQDQGPEEFERFRTTLYRAFPDREMFLLTEDHPLLTLFYDVDNLQMEHPMSGVKAIFYGFPDSKGRLAMVICYNNDVGDYWEFIDEPYYAVKPSAEALKLGVNFVIYAMTH
jgi:hypothetical protein